MAQAAESLTAQAGREPSMEEILASIRRIIEDSDSGRPDEPVPPPAANALPSVEVERFRSELTGRDPVSPVGARDVAEPIAAATPAKVSSPVTSFSAPTADLEERAPMPASSTAQKQAEPIRSTMGGEPIRSPLGGELMAANIQAEPASAPVAAAMPPAEQPVRTDPVQVNSSKFEHAAAAEVAPAVEAEPQARAEAVTSQDRAPRAEAVVSAPVASPAPATSAVPAQRSAILSDMAGRQVAAAFGELEEAFAASRRRSFDEIAEEMMRPMLQEWLDNNLPTLVEKLVREEIERVARGPAR